jgi:hypothetical protein
MCIEKPLLSSPEGREMEKMGAKSPYPLKGEMEKILAEIKA